MYVCMYMWVCMCVTMSFWLFFGAIVVSLSQMDMGDTAGVQAALAIYRVCMGGQSYICLLWVFVMLYRCLLSLFAMYST